MSSIVNAISSWFVNAYHAVVDNLTFFFGWTVPNFVARIESVFSVLGQVWSFVQTIYANVATWLGTAWTTVSSAVSSGIGIVQSWVESVYSRLSSWITSQVSLVSSWITTGIAGLWANIQAGFSQLLSNIGSTLAAWGQNIFQSVAAITGSLSSFLSQITSQMSSSFTWLTSWMSVNIVAPLGTWWDQFQGKILDFPSWIGRLFDAVSAWVTRDVPGSSPWYEGFLNRFWEITGEVLTMGFWTPGKGLGPLGTWFKTWLFDFPKYMFGDIPERTAYGLAASWDWFSKGMQPVVETFMGALADFTQHMGPFSPSMAAKNYSSILSVGATAAMGLVGMTIAGELLHPLKNLGLGNVAAMVFDLTNYKMLTGAFVTALATAAIALPMRYYYFELFRPNLPDLGRTLDFYASDDIDRAQFNQLMKYHGYPDSWLDTFADNSYEPPTLNSLSSLVTSGSYDRDLFEDILRRRRVPPALRPLLLDMYEKKANADVKAYGITNALTRYKLGMTTEDQCKSELALLHAPESQVPVYLAATRLAYATDYTQDLMTAYQAAVRDGNISADDYRSYLLDLGLVPERVEGLVLIEIARQKPAAKPTTVAPPKAAYLTDAGKIEMDTIRRQRRKNLITVSQEVSFLQGIGMPVNYATAIADNDTVRIGEAG